MADIKKITTRDDFTKVLEAYKSSEGDTRMLKGKIEVYFRSEINRLNKAQKDAKG